MNARRIHNRVCGGLLVLVLCAVPAWADIPLGVRACWELDEGSGTIAHDTSGNGFHGTFYSNPAWVPGVQGPALEFLDHDLVWQIPAAFDDTVTNGFTIASWVNRYDDPPPQKYGIAFDARRGDSRGGFCLWVGTDGGVSFGVLKNSTTYQRIDGTHTVRPDEWTHVTATFDYAASTLRLFVDGLEDSASPVPASEPYHNSYSNPAIGNNHWAPGDGQFAPFHGIQDEVYFYDRALSASEIYDLYAATPEPGSWVLLALGVAAAARRRG